MARIAGVNIPNHQHAEIALTAIYGIDQGKAMAAGLVLHALQNLPVLVLGLAFLGREGLSFGSMRRISTGAPPLST